MPNRDPFRADEPSEAEVREALARMLTELEFARNPNPTRFLQFIIAETLAGRGARLKAFSIATAALGRSDDFDPQNDSIVRVQAARLRAMLDSYYAGPGAGDWVRIELPRGSYRPKFLYVEVPSPAEAEAEAPAPTLEGPKSEASPAKASGADPEIHRVPWRKLILTPAVLLALGVVFLLALTVIARYRSGAAPAYELDRPPVVLVDAPQGTTEIAASVGAQRFIASFERELSSFDYLTVRMAETRSGSGRKDYMVTTRFFANGPDTADVSLSLHRLDTGEVLWSRQFTSLGLHSTAEGEKMGHSAASAVGDVGGAIFADLRARRLALSSEPQTGFSCRILGLEYVRNREPSLRLEALKCLQKFLSEEPENVGLLTMLSTMLILNYLDRSPESQGPSDPEEALQLARRAYDLAPQRRAVQLALFAARFYDKSFDDAFEIAQQMLATNPDSLIFSLALGRAFVSRGRYDEGVPLLEKADALTSGEQPIATAFLALADHMRRDFDAERRLLSRPVVEKTPIGLTLRIIDCQERANAACVQFASALLRKSFPGFASDVPAALDRYALAPSLKIALLSGLQSAGFVIAN